MRQSAWQKRSALTAAVVVLAALAPSASAWSGAFNPRTVGFSIKVGDAVSSYDTLALFALPGERVEVVLAGGSSEGFKLETPEPKAERVSDGAWHWTAPDRPGAYRLVLKDTDAGERMTLHVLVMVPRSEVKNGTLNGYRIGSYPEKAYKNLDIYRPPRGFVEVTQENADLAVSPHFTIRQFLCKQAGGYPKYVVLRPELVLKLEMILQEVNRNGIRTDTFHVMSGYRTPFYNKSIGNVKYSRHVWGGAADVFIDVDGNGMMDDLNGDKKTDWRDAKILYDLVDELYGKPRYKPFVGGLGRYKKTAVRGPFVHVDVRGFRARWGD